ncbi:MAG TPA: 4a-hydroxytetrahydrobiopterin dehydratase [Planktothrix sp.]|jgi:4a-hydroxytetrahydrobiopterin dehydratase
MTLKEKKCTPCSGSMAALTSSEIAKLNAEVDNWQVEEGKRLRKNFRFNDFQQAMNLAERVAKIAEEENHHPDLHIRYGELRVEIWTHAIDALTENDFILASKIDQAAKVR